MIFTARQFEFQFPRPALVMGIVNVTPDSFSDGGKFLSPDAAVVHALKLIAQGADILDIGGESTRPGAEPVSEEVELRRVIPVIRKLAPQVKVPISIDTTKPAVARARLLAKVREYEVLGPDERELRLRATELRWHLLPFFHEPATNHAARLALVPDDLRELVGSGDGIKSFVQHHQNSVGGA